MAFLKAIRLLALVALLVVIPARLQALPPPESEARVKAAFLYNFALFVDWPVGAFAHPRQLRVCVVGSDPVFAELQAYHGRQVNDRVLVVQQVSALDDPRGCQIVYVPLQAREFLMGALDLAPGAAVLSVGESDPFTRDGGVIRLFSENEHLRFEVNLSAAERAGLRVSSKMLGLARVMRDRR